MNDVQQQLRNHTSVRKYTGEEISQMTGLSRTSIYRIIREML